MRLGNDHRVGNRMVVRLIDRRLAEAGTLTERGEKRGQEIVEKN
jgi:hypothetical protein